LKTSINAPLTGYSLRGGSIFVDEFAEFDCQRALNAVNARFAQKYRETSIFVAKSRSPIGQYAFWAVGHVGRVMDGYQAVNWEDVAGSTHSP
jgi:hypothetical protein